MKQNVLVVHNYYQQSGGEGNVAENEASLLCSHGHNVFFYTRNNTEINGYGLFKKLLLPFSTLFCWKTYRDVRRIIAKDHIDVVHIHNTVPLVSPSVYYAAWSKGVPVVQTVHNYRLLCPNGVFFRNGHVCEECVSQGLICAVRHGCYRESRIQSLVLSATIGLHRLLGTYRRIEAYICLTSFAKEKLASKVPKAHIHVKPNIVDIPLAPIPYADHSDEYVFFGRLDAEKGVFVLLDAFAKLPDCSLTIIGGGPEEAAMAAYIAEHALTNVTMLGQLPHDQALAHVARAKAVVMPTQLYEGLPLTVLESFSLGTPVIGSQLGNVGALLTECGGGFVFDQTTPQALADCVLSLTPEALQSASNAALTAAVMLCDREQNYQTLMDIYTLAAQQRQTGTRP